MALRCGQCGAVTHCIDKDGRVARLPAAIFQMRSNAKQAGIFSPDISWSTGLLMFLVPSSYNANRLQVSFKVTESGRRHTLKVACAKRLHSGGHGPSSELQNVRKANGKRAGGSLYLAPRLVVGSVKFWWNSDEISLKFSKIWPKFSKILRNFCKILASFLLKFWVQSGAKGWKSCRSRKIWKNAPFLAIVAVDTAENEPSKVCPLSVYRSLRWN